MKFISNFKHPKGLTFKIEHTNLFDTNDNIVGEGYYLYVYDKDGFNSIDDLQDTLNFAKEVAFEDFGAPMDSWKEVK